jgi:hypothetical protein
MKTFAEKKELKRGKDIKSIFFASIFRLAAVKTLSAL